MIGKKVIYGIDFLIIVGTLATLFFSIGYVQPLLIQPIDGLETTNSSVLFSFEKASAILIDDNPEFSSPDVINARNDAVINLKPGIYYWKLDGVLESDVRKFTILSEIELKLREFEDGYEVVNAGNTRLNVDIYSEDVLTGSIVLDAGESHKTEEKENKFIGRQDGE